MGMVEVNMPSQSVYLVKYWQYNTSNSEWELNTTKNSNAANSTSAGGATDFTSSTWKPWAKTTSSCYLVGKPDAGTLPMSANRGTSNSFYSWEVTDIQITSENSFITTTLTPSDVYLKQAWEFSYEGVGRSFTIPATGTYRFECWGAQGGDITPKYSERIHANGGKGGYSAGTYTFSTTPTIYIYVGQNGYVTGEVTPLPTFGGGGAGRMDNNIAASRGGGATDIRLAVATGADGWSGDNSLKTRLVVAGGGGGACDWCQTMDAIGGNGNGGGGGGLNGCNGNFTYSTSVFTSSLVATKGFASKGATQTAGGTKAVWNGTEATITLPESDEGYYGSGGGGISHYHSGGGGGHYGGASGAAGNSIVSSAGGGSGFVSGASGCVAISGYWDSSDHSQVRFNNVSYKFTNTSLINGETSLPKSSGLYKDTYESSDKETGHSGDGFVRIVQISVD